MNEVEETVMAARQALQQSDVTSAERILAPLFRRGLANHPGVLLLAGLIRLQQGRIPEAEKIFTQGRVLAPGDAMLAYYHGGALGSLRRAEDAAQAYRAAIVLKPDLAEARLALSALLIETGEMEEAERITRGGLHLDMDPALRGVLHNNLALTLRAQRLDEEALENFEAAQTLNPAIPKLDMLRPLTMIPSIRPCTAPITSFSIAWTVHKKRCSPMTARPGPGT